jgi:hypothetical protein
MMTENELRTAMGFELCDCDECQQHSLPTNNLKETKMIYASNGYEPALAALTTPEQRFAAARQAEAFAVIDQQAAAISAANASFRAANQNRTKYPAPNPYAAVLKGTN